MTLYELTEKWQNLMEMLNDEALDDEALAEAVEFMEGEFEEKAENYAIIMQSLQNDMDSIDKELIRLKDRKDALKNNKDRLKKYLEMAMRTTGKTRFKTSRFSFSIQKNGGSLPVILKVSAEELPVELQTITVKANNKAITEYINKTGDNTWAEFGERGESLRIK